MDRVTRTLAIVFFVVVLLASGVAGCRTEKKEVLIGAPIPETGPYASDGEQMRKALQMAIDEKNAAGGLLGRPLRLIVGDVGGLEPEKIKAVGERLVGAGVQAVITGYDDGGVDTHVFGAYEMPYLHGNAMTLCTKPVAENPEYRNVFQYCPNEIAYGEDAAAHLFEVPKQMGWQPPNNRVAIIKVDYAYNIIPADEFKARAQKMGYEVVVDELTKFGVVEWRPILSKIEAAQPSYITFWNLDPTDAARFMTQFRKHFEDKGINALVFMQFTPTIPEFLQLAGEAAEGLIWTASIAPVGRGVEEYTARWVKKYGSPPKAVYAYATRDAFDIWVAAVEKVGDVSAYKQVCEAIRNTTYQGMCGTYKFNPADQSALPGEDLLPTVWYQIWGGKSYITGPGRLKQFDYRVPPWIKK